MAYSTPALKRSFFSHVLDNLAHLRSVTAAAISSPEGMADNFVVLGQPNPRASAPRPEIIATSSQYLRVMRIPLLQGRFLADSDAANAPAVAVLSQNLANYYWGPSSPLGQRIRFTSSGPWVTVVGVTGDVIEDWFSGVHAPLAYVSYPQSPSASATVLLRTSTDPLAIASEAQQIIRSIDRALPVFDVKTIEAARLDERSGIRAAAKSMTVYAAIALVLAFTGIYAVVSYFAASRTHEIGVRIALGATPRSILVMTLRHALIITGVGIAIGLPASILLLRVISSALFNAVQVDILNFASSTFILVAASLIASFVPSRKASRIEPTLALRKE
jgi:putative ABC transport system permease protein